MWSDVSPRGSSLRMMASNCCTKRLLDASLCALLPISPLQTFFDSSASSECWSLSGFNILTSHSSRVLPTPCHTTIMHLQSSRADRKPGVIFMISCNSDCVMCDIIRTRNELTPWAITTTTFMVHLLLVGVSPESARPVIRIHFPSRQPTHKMTYP